MSPSAQSIEQRRAKRLANHIVWLQVHMPSAAALNHRVRELRLLVGTDSNAVRMCSQTVATVTNKKEQLESCSFLSSLSVKILEREAYANF